MEFSRVTTPLGPAPATLYSGGQPGDLVSLADVKLELDVTATADDAYLQKLISRASAAAAKFCNRVFVPALWQDRVAPASDAYPWQLPPTLSRLQLQQWPLTASPSPAGVAPPQTPALSVVSGGALAATTYYARISFVTPLGETAPSLEAFLPCAANKLLQIAAPTPDPFLQATGYNVYLSSSSFAQTLQNTTPIALTSAWTLPTSGLVTGASPPNYVTVVETPALLARPLAEGVDFLADPALGQLIRLWPGDSQPRAWSLPVTVIYNAGFASIPADLQDAVILLAKARWYARTRDPMLRSENVVGVYEAAYWLGTGLGGQGDLPVDVAEKLERYRVKVVA